MCYVHVGYTLSNREDVHVCLDAGNFIRLNAGAILFGVTKYSVEDHPLDACREPSALQGWILEILHYDLKAIKAFLRIVSAEERGVRLC